MEIPIVVQIIVEDLEDLAEDLEVVTLTMEALVNKVLNLETQELTDTETQAVTDNILTTAQAVEEQLTAVNLDHQEMVEKVETAEMEEQRELQVQQDQAAELVDLGVEHRLEDQVVAEMVLLELVNLDQTVKVAVAEAVALDNHLLETAEMVS